MLAELVNYAKKNNIPDKPGFKAKRARWTILLSESGNFIDILQDERLYNMCPHLEQNELIAGGISRSHFLLDSFSVVLGLDGKGNSIKKHKFFINLLREASAFEPLLKLCADFLCNESLLIEVKEKVKAYKVKATDNVTFRIGSIYPIELDSWHEWWEEYRKTIGAGKSKNPNMVCFVTGRSVEPVSNHFKISGLGSVGGQSSGTVLIGFDKDSFKSYGLDQSLNAACSEEAAALYRNVLDDLIEKAPKPLAGTMFLHWYKEPIQQEDDLLLFIDWEPNDIDEVNARYKVKEITTAVQEGKRPELIQNKYYILQVSGAGGRIMVRDWICGDFGELVVSIGKWFDDLSIVSPMGNGVTDSFKLSAALVRLVEYRPHEKKEAMFKRIEHELSPIMPRLWRSILTGSALPRIIPVRALGYIRSILMNSDDNKNNANLDVIACALLKAWLIREKELIGGTSNMCIGLNQDHPSHAYHAGRMMAVLASLQQSALGDVGAGVVQRYYAAASTTPALVLGRLVRMAQFHIDKLDKGLAVWYENKLAEIAEKMGDTVPSTLTLEEQALFALGYYQQKAEMMSAKGNKKQNA